MHIFVLRSPKRWAVYMLLNVVARSLDVFMSFSILKAWNSFTRTAVLWRCNVAGNSKTYFGVRVNYSSLTRYDFWQIFIEDPNTKFHGNPPNGIRAVPYEQTDRHNEAYRRFLRLCSHARSVYFAIQSTEMISLNSINRLVCVVWRRCVFCEDGIEFLNIVSTSFRLHALCL